MVLRSERDSVLIGDHADRCTTSRDFRTKEGAGYSDRYHKILINHCSVMTTHNPLTDAAYSNVYKRTRRNVGILYEEGDGVIFHVDGPGSQLVRTALYHDHERVAADATFYNALGADVFVTNPTDDAMPDYDGVETPLVPRRGFINIPLEPVRLRNTIASLEQLHWALDRAFALTDCLAPRGFGDPIIAFSGNSFDLIWKLARGADAPSTGLILDFEALLEHLFSDDTVDLIRQNAPWEYFPLYGTVSRFGVPDYSDGRWHRPSGIVQVPSTIARLTAEPFERMLNDPPERILD